MKMPLLFVQPNFNLIIFPVKNSSIWPLKFQIIPGAIVSLRKRSISISITVRKHGGSRCLTWKRQSFRPRGPIRTVMVQNIMSWNSYLQILTKGQSSPIRVWTKPKSCTWNCKSSSQRYKDKTEEEAPEGFEMVTHSRVSVEFQENF